MTPVLLAWRHIHREWRSGELLALALAMALAVAVMAAVTALGERVRQGLSRQAADFLAADMVLIGRGEIPADWWAQARTLGLSSTVSVTFPSVVFAGEHSALAAIKGVQAGYPLRGEFTLGDASGTPVPATPPPTVGNVWVDPRLRSLLDVHIGDTIQVGNREFRFARMIAQEPDRGGNFFSLAPRLMMNREDILQAGLIGPGSRVTRRLMLAGKRQDLKRFQRWVEPKLAGQFRIQNPETTQQQLGSALARARRFLGLAALSAVFLAGVAVMLAAHRYSRRHRNSAAVMRCLGASNVHVAATLGGGVAVLGLLAGALSAVLDYNLQCLLAWLVADVLPVAGTHAGWAELIPPVLAGLVVLLGFALPPLLTLLQVPPMRVLQGVVQSAPGRVTRLASVLPLTAFAGLVVWQAGDWRLAGWVLTGFALLLGLLALLAWALLRILRRLGSGVGVSWRFGLANLFRHGMASIVQTCAIGLGLCAVLLLTLVRVQLFASWQGALAPDTPNTFLINIQADQRIDVQRFLAKHLESGPTPRLYPMAAARLVAINGKRLHADEVANPVVQRRLRGTLNVSWAETLAPGNQITAGGWWSDDEAQPEVSLAERWAQSLGVGVGDSVGFRVGSETISARVSSLRRVAWDSFHVNFFIVLKPGIFAKAPRSYLASFHLDSGDSRVTAALAHEFPNVNVIDAGALIAQVQRVMSLASTALNAVFAFTLLAGGLVLATALATTQDVRGVETAVLKALGAGRRRLLLGLNAEFLALGMLAGTTAAGGASAIAWVLARQVFEVPYQLNLKLLAVSAVLGIALVMLASRMGLRRVLNAPPAQVLQAEV